MKTQARPMELLVRPVCRGSLAEHVRQQSNAYRARLHESRRRLPQGEGIGSVVTVVPTYGPGPVMRYNG